MRKFDAHDRIPLRFAADATDQGAARYTAWQEYLGDAVNRIAPESAKEEAHFRIAERNTIAVSEDLFMWGVPMEETLAMIALIWGGER